MWPRTDGRWHVGTGTCCVLCAVNRVFASDSLQTVSMFACIWSCMHGHSCMAFRTRMGSTSGLHHRDGPWGEPAAESQ